MPTGPAWLSRLTRSTPSVLVAAAAGAALLTSCDPVAVALQPDTPATPPPAAAAELAALQVAPEGPRDGYDRDLFDHWSSTDTPRCNVRELALQRQGTDVAHDAQCRAVSGRWTSPYDNAVVTDPELLELDHLVALAEAWDSGAARWTPAERERFANDLDLQLVVVTAAINQGKSDHDPATWKPLRSYWCDYARAWITVKVRYALTADQAEHEHLAAMLATCAETPTAHG